MTNKRITEKRLVLTRYKRLNNSIYGNPRFEVTFTLPDHNQDNKRILHGKTATNASCAYSVTNYANSKRLADVTYHHTANDNIIIDQIEDSEER